MPLIARFAIVLAAVAVAWSFIAGRDAPACARYTDGMQFSVAGTLETRPDDAVRTVALRTDASGACATLRVRIPDSAPPLVVGDAVIVSGTWMVQRVTGERASGEGMLIGERVTRAVASASHPLLRARGRVCCFRRCIRSRKRCSLRSARASARS